MKFPSMQRFKDLQQLILWNVSEILPHQLCNFSFMICCLNRDICIQNLNLDRYMNIVSLRSQNTFYGSSESLISPHKTKFATIKQTKYLPK